MAYNGPGCISNALKIGCEKIANGRKDYLARVFSKRTKDLYVVKLPDIFPFALKSYLRRCKNKETAWLLILLIDRKWSTRARDTFEVLKYNIPRMNQC